MSKKDDRIKQWLQTAHAFHENLIREGTKHLRLTVQEACINLGEHPDHAYLMMDRIEEKERNARMKCKNT
jgi:hypothetical protein